jgi:hypothetical protein
MADIIMELCVESEARIYTNASEGFGCLNQVLIFSDRV